MNILPRWWRTGQTRPKQEDEEKQFKRQDRCIVRHFFSRSKFYIACRVNSNMQGRPQVVLFGDSIAEQSFRTGGWGASLADTYSRKVLLTFI